MSSAKTSNSSRVHRATATELLRCTVQDGRRVSGRLLSACPTLRGQVVVRVVRVVSVVVQSDSGRLDERLPPS
jgi:hypothetical protein